MIFNEAHNFEEEEEDAEVGIDDALLGELDDAVLDDPLIPEEIDPLIKSPLDALVGLDVEDPLKDGVKVVEDDEDEDVDDYDSFDDKDEM
jgi:hypothetical protein